MRLPEDVRQVCLGHPQLTAAEFTTTTAFATSRLQRPYDWHAG